MSLGYTAPDYHAAVLSFAEECVAAAPSSVTPQSLSGSNVTVASRSAEEEEAG